MTKKGLLLGPQLKSFGSIDGYYDDCGNWNRTKYCFISCGARCTCMPPMGLSYDPARDKRNWAVTLKIREKE